MEPPARSRAADQESSKQPEQEEMDEEDEEAPCLLDIYVHDARNIHNICIYADQDVYARFTLTSAPDHGPALSTRVAAAAGASPRFDERLPPLRVRRGRLRVDVLKCEVWMRSCAPRPVLGDQLLGFALVPLAAVAGADGGRLAGDFELSSTDLFHSPAGTIRLSLALRSGGVPGGACTDDDAEPYSITSEVVILDPPVDYSRIEFPDLNVVKEDHDMAVQYLPFLQELRREDADAMADHCEMSSTRSPDGDNKPAPAASSDGSKNDASTATTASEDRAVSSSSPDAASEKPLSTTVSRPSPDTPTSGGDVFKSPLGDIDMEAEQSAMQRQIMEMYVKSMQQFSESLGKMTLPTMELAGDVVQEEEKPDSSEAKRLQQQVKKDGVRVFYGSRAFF